jgi:hypothetical protein
MERVGLIPHHLQFHTWTMRGRVDRLAWKLPDDLSEEEWIEAGIVLARIDAGMMWWVGDYWIYGEKKYGARKAIVDDPNWQGPSFQTCANAASVCRAFETSRRREVLPALTNPSLGRRPLWSYLAPYLSANTSIAGLGAAL